MAFERFDSVSGDVIEGEVIRAYKLSQKRHEHPLLPKEKREDKLKSLLNTCNKLVRLIDELPLDLRFSVEYAEDPPHEVINSYRYDKDAPESLSLLEWLKFLADRAADRAADEMLFLPPKKQSLHYQKRHFILRLCQIYERAAGEKPPLIVDRINGKLVGRFAEFLEEVASLPEICEAPDTLKHRAVKAIPLYRKHIKRER